ncbi:hypothetical protein PBRA_006566 [Plasmodiophora brassicae]|uniref:Uncharacterized protein n=1 Tax=Plasmodiophora brassicae TaxID=37360 RepID=A0A0G4IT97_PLABS|nr:hypothetical protein PBRA_006566 [Plasmodiophora brassicae]
MTQCAGDAGWRQGDQAAVRRHVVQRRSTKIGGEFRRAHMIADGSPVDNNGLQVVDVDGSGPDQPAYQLVQFGADRRQRDHVVGRRARHVKQRRRLQRGDMHRSVGDAPAQGQVDNVAVPVGHRGGPL